MSRAGGLGRGLEALIPTATSERTGLRSIPLANLEPNPKQPRDAFGRHSLAELAQSLQTVGLLQPILVRQLTGDRYQIIAGERRFRAAQLAGFREISAVVRASDDDHVLTEALVENIHRVDLNALEEAAAYQQLLEDFGLTHEQLAAKIGKSRSNITNTLRLLGLDSFVQQLVAAGDLSPGHARALLPIEHIPLRRDLAERVVQQGLSVRATEQLVRRAVKETPPTARAEAPSPFKGLQQRLSNAFSTKVRITGSEDRGQVVIDFSGQQDLERLLSVLEGGVGEGLNREPSL